MKNKKPEVSDVEFLYEEGRRLMRTMETLIKHYQEQSKKLTGLIIKLQRQFEPVKDFRAEAREAADEIRALMNDYERSIEQKLKAWEKKYKLQQSAITQIQDWVTDKLGDK